MNDIELIQVTYSVRAAQAILQYGVGAMVDFPNQTLMTASTKYWDDFAFIYDERFAKALGVNRFIRPNKIPYVRFPQWYFCPKCRRFQTLMQWNEQNNKEKKDNPREYKQKLKHNMAYYLRCPKCKCDLVVARIITVCNRGHINDFPWVEWVHAKQGKEICKTPSLTFKTNPSGSEGLEGLTIECSCKCSATLKDAFGEDIFAKLYKKTGMEKFKCEGLHPYKFKKESCDFFPVTVQRGSSSVYFPVVYSSLVIPPYSGRLTQKIENSITYKICNINFEQAVAFNETAEWIKNKLPEYAKKLSEEIGANRESVEEVLIRKFSAANYKTDVTSTEYRFEEYNALKGKKYQENDSDCFSLELIKIEDYKNLPFVKTISLVNTIKIVKTLIGFSRINPVEKGGFGFVDIKGENLWYPAYEIKGEGIFLELDENAINNWIHNNPEIKKRVDIMKSNSEKSLLGRTKSSILTPKFVLLHTLSHLLIKQLSFECGYSIASLSERLYWSKETDKNQMAGIFIYTTSGDSEGSLGGLVRQGRTDIFPQIFNNAILSAKTCSNDPICILSRGQGRDSLNLASCYACSLLPETCCEMSNSFLDRALVVGTYKADNIGFYSEIAKRHFKNTALL